MAQIGQVVAQSLSDDQLQSMRLSTPRAQITDIIDGQILYVNKTEAVTLPAIFIPQDGYSDKELFQKKAKDYLDETYKGKTLRIYQVKNKPRGLTDALGRMAGYPVTMDDTICVQGDLVSKGLAFAYPTQSHQLLSDTLYDLEDNARKDKKGLWADDMPQFLYSADDIVDKKDGYNYFAIIEGTIQKVASHDNMIYLNFGDNWKDDFTVAMQSVLRRDFSKHNINVMNLAGKKIQARGWVRSYNGPYLEIFDVTQMRVME